MLSNLLTQIHFSFLSAMWADYLMMMVHVPYEPKLIVEE